MLQVVLASVLLVISLVGYLAYSKIKDQLSFTDMKFTEMSYVSDFVQKFEPKGPKSRITKDVLYILFNEFSIKEFTLARLIFSVLACVFSISIAYTSFLSTKASVFKEYRALPFLVSESDYLVLSKDLTFQEIDFMRDINVMSSNILETSDVSRYLNASSPAIYDTLEDINKDLSGKFSIMPFVMFIGIFILLYNLPTLFIKFGLSLIKSNTDMEYFKLESFICLNCDSSVEDLAVKLEKQAVVFKKLFRLFIVRYRENPDLTYQLIFTHRGIHRQFKILVEYLNRLETVSPDVLKSEISMNQENNLAIIERNLASTREKRVKMCNIISVTALFAALGGIIIALISTLDLSSLNLGGF